MVVGRNQEVARAPGQRLQRREGARVSGPDHHDLLEVPRSEPPRARIALDAHDRDPAPAERAHDGDAARMLDAEHEGPRHGKAHAWRPGWPQKPYCTVPVATKRFSRPIENAMSLTTAA